MEAASFGTVLIGPSALLREGLAHILDATDFGVLASASETDISALSSLPQDRPLLLIIEVGRNFEATLAQIEGFKARYPAARVAVLTHPHQPHRLPDMVLAFRAGANAYFVNVATCDVFIKSLELIMLGETILPSAILPLLRGAGGGPDNGNGHLSEEDDDRRAHEDGVKGDDRVDDDLDHEGADDDMESIAEALPEIGNDHGTRLSSRQKLILNCLIEGDSNKTIARKMHITEATVKVHLKAILRKIRVHNRTQAAIWAMNNGSSIWTKDTVSSALSKFPIPPLLQQTRRLD
jgi:two-component system, NarL family, nitrate/nitrite response regulator NarL